MTCPSGSRSEVWVRDKDAQGSMQGDAILNSLHTRTHSVLFLDTSGLVQGETACVVNA